MPEQKTDIKNTQGPLHTGLVFFENQTNDKTAGEDVLSKLDSALLTQDTSLAQFKLILTDEHLTLQLNQPDAPGAIYADFISGKAKYRLGQGELIYKAMGLSKLKNPSIIDATAGLGRDAFVLASKGCKVILIERSPILFLLLEDALKRACDHPDTKEIAQRMKLVSTDARTYLSTKNMSDADIIYLDPMYPERKKSALVKKEMQIFQKLLGKNETGHDLLPLALEKAKHRVVVKRPRKGEHLNNQKPDYSIQGKSIRFDVYTSKLLV